MISEDKEQQEKAYRADLQYLKDKVSALTITQPLSPPAWLPGCQQVAAAARLAPVGVCHSLASVEDAGDRLGQPRCTASVDSTSDC